jgi:hypothetical protein
MKADLVTRWFSLEYVNYLKLYISYFKEFYIILLSTTPFS